MSNPFRYFNSSPEVIRLVVMMYVRYPLSLRNVEDLLASAGLTSAKEMGPLYHGSKAKLTSLDPTQLQARDPGFYGKGFYTATTSQATKA